MLIYLGFFNRDSVDADGQGDQASPAVMRGARSPERIKRIKSACMYPVQNLYIRRMYTMPEPACIS